MENFKSEKARQDYYKKLHLKNNAIAQKVDDKLTEAYHEVEFGVVPQIEDNRSLAEKLADERLNQDQAQKNALMLMSNDGSETTRLLNLIGTAGYQEFNRYFLDIFNSLKGQIGKIGAQDAYNFIDRYITKANVTNGVDIPNVTMLNQLINAIQNIPAPTAPVNIDFSDIVLRLQALETVLINTANTLNKVEYNTQNLPTGQDIVQILDLIDGSMRNSMEMNDEFYKKVEQSLQQIVSAINEESLEDVISAITVDDNFDDEFDDGAGGAGGDDGAGGADGDDGDDGAGGDDGDDGDGGDGGDGGDDGDDDKTPIIDDILEGLEALFNEPIDEATEIKIANIIQIEPEVSNIVQDIITVIEKEHDMEKDLKQQIINVIIENLPIQSEQDPDDATVLTTASQISNLDRLREETANIIGNAEKISQYNNAYDIVTNNVEKITDQNYKDFKKNLIYLLKIHKVSTKAIVPMTTIQSIKDIYYSHQNKFQEFHAYINRKKGEYFNMYNKAEKDAFTYIENYIENELETESDRKLFMEKYIKSFDRMIGYLERVNMDNIGKLTVNTKSREFKDYKYLAEAISGVNADKMTAMKTESYANITKAPYPTIYAYLKNRLATPTDNPNPQNVFEETKTGNGLKKMKNMFKKRVY